MVVTLPCTRPYVWARLLVSYITYVLMELFPHLYWYTIYRYTIYHKNVSCGKKLHLDLWVHYRLAYYMPQIASGRNSPPLFVQNISLYYISLCVKYWGNFSHLGLHVCNETQHYQASRQWNFSPPRLVYFISYCYTPLCKVQMGKIPLRVASCYA